MEAKASLSLRAAQYVRMSTEHQNIRQWRSPRPTRPGRNSLIRTTTHRPAANAQAGATAECGRCGLT